MFLMWDVTARYHEKPNSHTLTSVTGGSRIHTGPVLVLYRENVMFRAEYKWKAYENLIGVGNSRGDIFQLGLGITF